MRYPASETEVRHDRILDASARLFRERGFAGVTVAEIMSAAGLTHGAFYAHFPTKEALYADAAGRAESEMLSHVARAAALGARWAEFAASYLSGAHRDRPGEGCACAALGAGLARQPRSARAPFTAQLRTAFAEMTTAFAWRRDRPARQQAIAQFAMLVGSLVLARAVDDGELSDEILASARAAAADTD